MYTIEHLVATFTAGVILGVISTILLSRQEITIERIVALLLMAVWMGMHIYGFFFEREVDWVFNVVGFGAAGTFVGINIRSTAGLNGVVKLLKK